MQASSTAVIRYPWTGFAPVRSVGNTALTACTSVCLGQVVLSHAGSLWFTDLLEQGVVVLGQQTEQVIRVGDR